MSEKVTIISCDTHIGPRVREDLREYCPEKHLPRYDQFLDQVEKGGLANMVDGLEKTTGHYDTHQRIRDLNQDGTAAEVIFHGSQNGMPIPFNISDFSTGSITADRVFDTDEEEAAVGRHMYNAWLADYCSVEPERHVGAAQLPMWDRDEAIKEMTWARENGLKAINFPADSGPGLGNRSRLVGQHVYNDPYWDPFWAAAQDLDMPLACHGGAGNPDLGHPGGHSIWLYEAQEQSKKPVARLILGGVFERYPGLKLVITEQPGDWWRIKMADLDSMESPKGGGAAGLPMKPSEYAMRNVFIGTSFQARFEAEDAMKEGYWTQCLWGTDYPHVEGTWKQLADDTLEPYSQRAMRHTYNGLDHDKVKAILSGNACKVYDLDEKKLSEVAQRINAPTWDKVNTPLEQIPEDYNMWSFRQSATFA